MAAAMQRRIGRMEGHFSENKMRGAPKLAQAQRHLTVGADPEMFATDDTGKIRSVIGLIGGSKLRPLQVSEGFFVQEDNVALEFNIQPATKKSEFIANISAGVEHCKVALGKVNLHAHIAGSVSMPDSELQSPYAFEFGCNPFHNAWSFEKPKALSMDMLVNPADRFAAGHIHIGIPGIDSNPLLRAYWARALDVCLAGPALWWMTAEELEQERVRRTMYGKAGSYRPKSYGLEYIALSNFWIKHKNRMGAVWDAINHVYHSYSPEKNGPWLGNQLNAEAEMLREAINRCDKAMAKPMLDTLLGGNTAKALIKLPQTQASV